MQEEVIIGTVIGAVAGILAGIPLSLVGYRYLAELTRQKRRLGYQVVSANVIIPKLPKENPDVRVMVAESVLTPGGDPTTFADVEEIYGFRVRIRNSGNVELTDQVATFQFPRATKIILADFETAPEFGAVQPQFEIDNEAARMSIRFPFLNPKDEALISIQSVRNPNLACKVGAVGPGLETFDMAERSRKTWRLILGGVVAALGVPGGISLGLSLSDAFSRETAGVLENVGVALLFLAAMIGGPMVIAAGSVFFERLGVAKKGSA